VRAGAGTAELQSRSILDLAECFHLANVLETLEQLGIFESLENEISVETLARRHRVDRALLESALRFLSLRTELVVRRAGKFRVARNVGSNDRFIFHQYLGAYGKNGAEFASLLRHPALAPRLIDRRRHALAFMQIDSTSANFVADLVLQLDFNNMLDLGCGTGALLANIALRKGEFVGWGLDMNPWMCAAARKRIAAAGAARRVRIFSGDCRRIADAIPARIRQRVNTVCAASLANEFFTKGRKEAVEWLSGLRKILPERTLLLADYYGGRHSQNSAGRPEIALHDFVQAASGQGVPPPNLAGWKKIYNAAGCKLVYVLRIERTPYFMHLLRL